MFKRFKWWVYKHWCWLHGDIPEDIYGLWLEGEIAYHHQRETPRLMKHGLRILTLGRKDD